MSEADLVYREWDGAPSIPVDVRKNAEQRLACVILIDCSGSMSIDNKIEQVNQGLVELERALKDDPLASVRVVVSVIAFGTSKGNGVEVVQEWTDAIDFIAPQFGAQGTTPMGCAVDTALDALEEMRQHFRANGIAQYKPWLFILTDGQPTDDYHSAAARCAKAVAEKSVNVWPITTDPHSAAPLKKFVGEKGNVYAINSTNVRELFLWLSASMKSSSTQNPGQSVQLEAPGKVVTVEL